MSIAFNTARAIVSGALNDFFTCCQKATRSPGFVIEPNLASKVALSGAIHLQGYTLGWQRAENQTELVKKVVFPIFIGFAVGITICGGKDYPLKAWMQDFAIDCVTIGTYIEITNRPGLNRYKQGLYVDVLFAVKACASFALDKSRNPSLPFTAHCSHAILTTLTTRIAKHIADKQELYMDEKHVRDATIQKIVFIALIFPVQSLLETKLQYNWKILGADTLVRSLASYALYSPSSPIVQRYG